jgi:hypothetical protein
MNKSCGTCKHGRLKMNPDKTVNVQQRLCRRFPPTSQNVLIPQAGGGLMVNNMNFYPTVDAIDEGCGEYVLNLASSQN